MAECDKCRSQIRGESGIRCEGVCGKLYHSAPKCSGIDNYSLGVLGKGNFIRFICDNCIRYVLNVDEVLRHVLDCTQKNKQRLSEYKSEFEAALKKNTDDFKNLLVAIENRYDERFKKLDLTFQKCDKSVSDGISLREHLRAFERNVTASCSQNNDELKNSIQEAKTETINKISEILLAQNSITTSNNNNYNKGFNINTNNRLLISSNDNSNINNNACMSVATDISNPVISPTIRYNVDLESELAPVFSFTPNSNKDIEKPGSSLLSAPEIASTFSSLLSNNNNNNTHRSNSEIACSSPNSTRGKKELRVIPPNKHIFISRFASDTTADEINAYIKFKLNFNDISVYKFTYLKARNITSFKVTVPFHLFNIVKEQSFWPPHVLVREYEYTAKRRPRNIARLPTIAAANSKNY